MSNVETFFLIIDFLAIGIIVPVVIYFSKLMSRLDDMKDALVEIKDAIISGQDRSAQEHKELLHEAQESRRDNSSEHKEFLASLAVLTDRSQK